MASSTTKMSAWSTRSPPRTGRRCSITPSIGFFTRPEPQRPAPDARIFHVTITSGDRSRELAVNDPFEAPELAMLIRLTRRAMRDRLVLTPDMLNERQLEAIRTAVVRHRAGDDEAADQGT
jgi:hypothetical protein